jgi:glycosyltransferase involved in cell wall biosynthesis
LKIKGMTRQDEGGGYYRMHQPLGELGLHGHDVTVGPARTDEGPDGADIVVGQMIGVVPSWWRNMSREAKLVYELDDDPFEVEPHNPVYHVYSDPVTQDGIRHCIEVSHLVTASTEPLAERMREINPNVVVLKNRIDEHLLSIQRPQRDRVVIGWAGGASHLKDIKVCASSLRGVLNKYRNKAEVHFIGVNYSPLVTGVNLKGRESARFTPWAHKTTDYYKLIDFDIGLAPLVPTRFAETKSYIKALEYAALGIPVIASDVAPYRDFVIDGVTGWLVREHEWSKRIRELLCDEAMRTEMGAKAKEVAREYTIQKGWPEWESAYASL